MVWYMVFLVSFVCLLFCSSFCFVMYIYIYQKQEQPCAHTHTHGGLPVFFFYLTTTVVFNNCCSRLRCSIYYTWYSIITRKLVFTLSLTSVSNDHNDLTWPSNRIIIGGIFFKKSNKIIKNYQVNTTARQGDRDKEKQKKVQKNHLILIFFNILLLF